MTTQTTIAWTTRFLKGGALLLSIPVVAITLLFGVLQIQTVRQSLFQQLQQATAQQGMAVRIGRVDGLFPFQTAVESLTIEDAHGIWLTIRDLKWSLSVAALWQGKGILTELTAQTVTLARLPDDPQPAAENENPDSNTPEAEGSFDPTDLPGFLQVERFHLDALNLGEPLLPGGGRFTLDGSLKPVEDSLHSPLRLRLKALRTDTAGTSLNLETTVGMAPPHAIGLTVSLEDRTGLLEKLSQQTTGPVFLDLQGEGPLSSWQGKGSVNLPRWGAINSDIHLEIRENGLRANLDGIVTPQASILPDTMVADLLSTGVRLNLRADLPQSGQRSIHFQTQVNDILDLTGNLTDSGQEAESILGDGTIRLPNLQRLSPLAGLPLEGSSQWTFHLEGSPDKPILHLKNDSKGVKIPGLSTDEVQLALTVHQTEPLTGGIQDLKIEGSATVTGLRPDDLPEWPEPNLTLTLAAILPDDDHLRLDSMRIHGAGFKLEGEGQMHLTSLKGKARWKASVPRLAHYRPIDRPSELTGSGQIEALLDMAELWTSVALQLDGQVDHLAGLPEEMAILAGKKLQFKAKATVPLTPGLSCLQRLTLTGDRFALQSKGCLDSAADRSNLETTLKIDDLHPFSPLLGTEIFGQATATTTVTGSVTDPTLGGTVTIDHPILGALSHDQGTLTFRAEHLTQKMVGHFLMEWQSTDDFIRMASPFRRDQRGILHLDDLAINLPNGRLQGPWALDPASGLAEGSLVGRINTLTPLGRLLDIPLTGVVDLNLNVDAEPPNKTQNLTLQLQGNRLSYEETAIDHLELEATVEGFPTKPEVEIQTQITDLHAGPLRLTAFQMKAHGPLGKAIQIHATSQGNAPVPFDLSLTSQVQYDSQNLTLAFKQVSGHLSGDEIFLKAPFTIVSKGNNLLLSPLTLRWGPSLLTAQMDLTDRQATGHLLLNLPMEQALLLSGRQHAPWRGLLHLETLMKGTPQAPSIQSKIQIDQLQLVQPSLKQPLKGTLAAQVTLKPGLLSSSGTLSGVIRKPAHFSATIPLTLSLRPFNLTQPNLPLQAEVHAAARLERLLAFFPLDQQKVEGDIKVDLTVAGQPETLNVRGEAIVSDLVYENGLYGTVLRHGQARVIASGESLELTSLEINDGESGKIQGSGQLSLQADQDYPWSMALRMNDATLVRQDDLTVRLDGEIDAKGDAQQADISGKITTRRVDYFLPESFGHGIDHLEVRESSANDQMTLPKKRKKHPPFQTNLDLSVTLPGMVFVKGKGLISEWQGALNVRGQAESPTIVGNLAVRKGEMQVLGKRFNLSESAIYFEGAKPIAPRLDVGATLESKDIVAHVALKGRPDQLKLELSSQPSLPQEEILSRILFGEGTLEITPLQAAKLASAVHTLQGGGPGVMDKVLMAVGIDSLDFQGGDTDDASVKAGKRINEKLFIEVEGGMKPDSGKVSMEYEVMPNIIIETQGAQDATGSLGIRWKRNY